MVSYFLFVCDMEGGVERHGEAWFEMSCRSCEMTEESLRGYLIEDSFSEVG